MGCGTCVAACPLGAISREGVSNAEIALQISEMEKAPPALTVFICDWSLRVDDDLTILENYPEELVNVVHIPCTGRIDPQHALMALDAGIQGVLVCGCKPGECHFKRGNHVATCKMSLLDTMLGQMALPQDNIRFIKIGTQDRGRIKHEIEDMLDTLGVEREAA
jgi:heterodisulfide reductase subunit A